MSLDCHETENSDGSVGAESDEYTYYHGNDFDLFLFIALLPAKISRTSVPQLPPKHALSPEMTLVLDLDETLVHCSYPSIDPEYSDLVGRNPDFTFSIGHNGGQHDVMVHKRPFLNKFLEWCSTRFEVVIFTASKQCVADKIIDHLDPKKQLIRHRLFRNSCTNVDGNFFKDLSTLGRDLSKLFIIDNSPEVFSYQLNNGIPIRSWYNCPKDRELLHLRPLLATIRKLSLKGSKDVREILKGRFGLADKIVDRYSNWKNGSDYPHLTATPKKMIDYSYHFIFYLI